MRRTTLSILNKKAYGKTAMLGGLISIPLVLGAVWESALYKTPEQMLQLIGIITLAACAWISYRLPSEERRSVETAFLVVFLILVSAMSLFPRLLRPAPEFIPTYRGVMRWRGWLVDPNDAGIVLGLAAVIALRLRSEVSRRYSAVLLAASALCTLQLLRTFSRVGMLSAALTLLAWLGKHWMCWTSKWKSRICWGVLLAVALLPLSATSLRYSQLLPLRRLSSVSNTMDLSWANRLYVLPGTIQAASDRPWLGWGWGEVLHLHQEIYSPTFLKESTAVLLNDFANLAASHGFPVLFLILGVIGWCLLCGRNCLVSLIIPGLTAAMFFQGVIRVPFTLLPLCTVVGLVLGANPPWKRHRIAFSGFPFVTGICLVCFIVVWCFIPLLGISRVSYDGEKIVVSPHSNTSLTICLLTEGDLAEYGREAKALASLGARAIVTHSKQLPIVQRSYGTNFWVVDSSPGPNRISPQFAASDTFSKRALKIIHEIYDRGVQEIAPTPDKPYQLRLVILTLYACILAVLVRECCVTSRKPLRAMFVAVLISAVGFAGVLRPTDWLEENREIANWARQMRKLQTPGAIYQDYVLNAEIAPNFFLRNRREVWHTFYQTSQGLSGRGLLEKLKEDIESQILIRPDRTTTIKSFEEIWKTRTCNLSERWYFLAAALRALNVPARVRDGVAEMWLEGDWVSTAPPS